MQLISRFNKGFRFLLCVIDIYSKNGIKNENISNKKLAEELHKPIIIENLIKEKYIHLL